MRREGALAAFEEENRLVSFGFAYLYDGYQPPIQKLTNQHFTHAFRVLRHKLTTDLHLKSPFEFAPSLTLSSISDDSISMMSLIKLKLTFARVSSILESQIPVKANEFIIGPLSKLAFSRSQFLDTLLKTKKENEILKADLRALKLKVASSTSSSSSSSSTSSSNSTSSSSSSSSPPDLNLTLNPELGATALPGPRASRSATSTSTSTSSALISESKSEDVSATTQLIQAQNEDLMKRLDILSEIINDLHNAPAAASTRSESKGDDQNEELIELSIENEELREKVEVLNEIIQGLTPLKCATKSKRPHSAAVKPKAKAKKKKK